MCEPPGKSNQKRPRLLLEFRSFRSVRTISRGSWTPVKAKTVGRTTGKNVAKKAEITCTAKHLFGLFNADAKLKMLKVQSNTSFRRKYSRHFLRTAWVSCGIAHLSGAPALLPSVGKNPSAVQITCSQAQKLLPSAGEDDRCCAGQPTLRRRPCCHLLA